MSQLLIRNIDDTLLKRLKLRAKEHHRSLQGELRSIVEAATKWSIKEASDITQQWHKRLAGGTFSDSAALLREDRNR